MMNDIAKMQDLWQEMSSWMTTYMKSFYSPEAAKTAKSHLEIKSAKTIFFDDAQIVDGIILKEKHTWKVVKNCENLAKHLNLNEHDSLLAKMIGLFHDVGRFYQFTVYRTFNDALSENHAKLGLKVIKDLPFMTKLDKEDLATLKFLRDPVELKEPYNKPFPWSGREYSLATENNDLRILKWLMNLSDLSQDPPCL